jgi:NAD(P)-dependent dehydrogenase (short-subunit alcohol dehydrogenase family)
MMSYKDKTIVITGGTQGIGDACVKVFHSQGGNVVILDIDEDGAEQANKLGDRAIFIHCDVSREKQVQSAIEKAIATFGEINILVNNAGIQRYTTVTETTEEEWDLVMDVNLKSAFLCAKHAIPSMLKAGNGCIINVASVQSFISQKNVAPYTTSKTALLGLTRSISVDYAPIVRCVAVCPGTVDTPMLREAIKLSPNPDQVYQECVDMHLTQRIGNSNEVAELIAYLASDKSGFITGQAIRIDGGLGVSIPGSKRD